MLPYQSRNVYTTTLDCIARLTHVSNFVEYHYLYKNRTPLTVYMALYGLHKGPSVKVARDVPQFDYQILIHSPLRRSR